MSKTTFEIIFDCNEMDTSIYPERTMFSKNSIVIDADNRHIIPSGKEEVKILVNGQYKVYKNVFSVCPYVY